ncbi:RNA polymerase sigma factor, sigma-70 family [Rivularia sp. PCC 7116]|uniref:sigma-70 family RNA polymerase sigma factor n=1 Tax=Rivularia sp. PCC 7116 TaxID=373994 RepID=UPI00029F225D|nr:sigma-70 family RNA polymerase sigma factor [Rivularia sp. PCC 7116]AFY56110.1 RNA polymerase sigma factor, sigma-70 family [Rivularia sp. PCC 7116]
MNVATHTKKPSRLQSDSDMSLSNQTEAELFQALQAGDLSALGAIYDRYGEAVYRLALRILKDKSEAEDLTQEIFLAFWRSAKYDPNRGKMIVYLLTMTRSRAINRLHQKSTQQKLLQRCQRSTPTHSESNLMEKVSLGEVSQIIGKALEEIPENQQQVLKMAYYEGLSQSEITEKLNIPLGTVKTRTRQGLLKLRKLLKDLVD